MCEAKRSMQNAKSLSISATRRHFLQSKLPFFSYASINIIQLPEKTPEHLFKFKLCIIIIVFDCSRVFSFVLLYSCCALGVCCTVPFWTNKILIYLSRSLRICKTMSWRNSIKNMAHFESLLKILDNQARGQNFFNKICPEGHTPLVKNSTKFVWEFNYYLFVRFSLLIRFSKKNPTWIQSSPSRPSKHDSAHHSRTVLEQPCNRGCQRGCGL